MTTPNTNLMQRIRGVFKQTAEQAHGEHGKNTSSGFFSDAGSDALFDESTQEIRQAKRKLEGAVQQYERSLQGLLSIIEALPDPAQRLDILNGFFYQQLLVIRQTANEAMEC